MCGNMEVKDEILLKSVSRIFNIARTPDTAMSARTSRVITMRDGGIATKVIGSS